MMWRSALRRSEIFSRNIKIIGYEYLIGEIVEAASIIVSRLSFFVAIVIVINYSD